MSPRRESLATLLDADLVRLLQQDDTEVASAACLELLERYRPLLRRAWRPVREYCKGQIEEGDFVQDVLVRLLTSVSALRDPRAFPGYMKAVVHSVAMNTLGRFRQDFSRREMFAELTRGDSEDVETRLLIESYLRKLSESERRIVELSVLKERPTDEVAAILGMTPGGFRSVKSKIINRLRNMILQDADDLAKKF